MGYACTEGDDQAPVLLVTNLDAGETAAVCADHLAGFALSLLVEATGTGWEPTNETAPDPETDEPSDEDDSTDGAAPLAPTPETFPEADPAQTEDGDELADGEHDQVGEDNATYEASLREELGAAAGG